jgi:hypothetical protein
LSLSRTKLVFSRKYFLLSAIALGSKYFSLKCFLCRKYFDPRTKLDFSRKYFHLRAIALGGKYLGENIFLKKLKKIWGKIKNKNLGQNNLGENIQHHFTIF